MEKTRLRIRFSKTGDLRWISHRDLARVWERLLRRADLQMAFSEGFHPKPRISFPSALALGVEALEEVVELEVVGIVDLELIRANIEREMPNGMDLIQLESPAYGLGKAKVLGANYRLAIPKERIAALEARLIAFGEQELIEVERKNSKQSSFRVDEAVGEIHLNGEYLHFHLPHSDSGSLRPVELLQELGVDDLLEDGAVLQRCEVELKEPTAD